MTHVIERVSHGNRRLVHWKKYKKLHLGCGRKYFDDWCNIDLNPQVDGEMHRGTEVRIDIEADLSNLPASDNIADLAFCSHVFEHFSFDEAINTLQEIFRVLKPGGIVVIEMPERTAVSLFSLFSPVLRKSYTNTRFGLTHSIAEAQFYGVYWEQHAAPFAVHKFLWAKKDFKSVVRTLGFECILSTYLTLTHVPIRDCGYILKKPGGTIEKSEFIKNYMSKRRRLFAFFKGLLILSPLPNPKKLFR